MDLNADDLIKNAIADAIREGVKNELLQGYNSPLNKLINDAVAAHQPAMRAVLEQGIASCLNDAEFREQLKAAVRQSLAKVLVQRFGGELEKQVNVLKSDPTTRARITLALEQIVAGNG